jgi:xanthine dehydrogenase large subunit
MNGMAAQAARKIKRRLTEFAAEKYKVQAEDIVFLPNRVRIGNQEVPFKDLVKQAYMGRVSLSATGYYRTPKIHYDRETASGRPFLYFAYGAAVSEVMIDTLTGEYTLTRVDIRDMPRSLNGDRSRRGRRRLHPGHGLADQRRAALRRAGRLRTHAPSTYKIPTCLTGRRISACSCWNARTARRPFIAPRRWASRR